MACFGKWRPTTTVGPTFASRKGVKRKKSQKLHAESKFFIKYYHLARCTDKKHIRCLLRRGERVPSENVATQFIHNSQEPAPGLPLNVAKYNDTEGNGDTRPYVYSIGQSPT